MIQLLSAILFSVLFLFAPSATLAQDLSAILPESVDKFSIYIGAVVLVIEFLIANAKIKSNSTIDLVINFIKKIFGTDRYQR